MANSFLTGENLARTAAQIVGQDLGLASLVYRDLAADFRPGKSNVVAIPVPGAVASQVKDIYDTTTPLTSGDIVEQFVNVTLTDHVYDSVVLSEGDMDLEIVDFARQVLRPQATAIVKHIERVVATAMQATPVNTAIAYAATDPAKAFTQIRRQLRDNGVSTDAKLTAAVGSGVYADLLDADALENGQVRGFQVVESTRLASDEIVAFVPEAFALVARAPQVPDGAPYGASVNEGGFALRHLRVFDSSVAVDRSIVSSFVAAQALPLAVDNEDGTVSLVANGGAVHMLTGDTEPV